MTLSPLASSHCLICGAPLSGAAFFVAVGGLAALAVAAAISVARIKLRMVPPGRVRSVRIPQSNLKAERLLPSRDRAEGGQVARLEAGGVAEVEQVEQVGDELKGMEPILGQERVEVVDLTYVELQR